MDKKTKMYVGLGLLAVVGYYLWEKSKKDKAADAAKAAATPATASIEGPIAGRRMGMVGMTGNSVNMDATMKQNAQVKDSKFAWGNFSAQNEVVKDGSWANAGGNIAPNFFKVEDSANSFR